MFVSRSKTATRSDRSRKTAGDLGRRDFTSCGIAQHSSGSCRPARSHQQEGGDAGATLAVVTSGESQVLRPDALVRLAFWAKNMTAIRNAGMQWPGFSYTDAEWARMGVLADAVSDGAFHRFNITNAVIFIILAALGIVGIFLPLASLLFPRPAETSALSFVLLLAASALLIIGVGLPISMRIAAATSAYDQTRSRISPDLGDAALARKAAYQINRIAAIMCGVFVPGTLLWIAFNVKAGPIITALKWFSIAAMAASIAYSRRPAPK
jgi:hypothetical protein